MHEAIQGALVGFGIGAFLCLFEYLMLRRAVNERAERYKRAAEFDITERRRLSTIVRFSLVLPVAFALGFWLVWG